MSHKESRDQIIQAFYRVNNKLGFGFLKKIYEDVVRIESIRMGLKSEQQ